MTSARTAVQELAQHERSRREMLALAVVGGARCGLLRQRAARRRGARERAARRTKPAPGTFRLTVLGTTDTHGNALNWDYFKDVEYDDSAHNDIGLAKISTLVDARCAPSAGRTTPSLLDAGDTIQGTPLAYYYAKVDPITGGSVHPMAKAMNAIGYDAAALGNHEFNYGLDTLRTFEAQCDFPLLSANSVDWTTRRADLQALRHPHLQGPRAASRSRSASSAW